MKPSLLLLACLWGSLSAGAQPSQSSITADLILKNARVYTDHDTGRGWSQALSIRHGSILTIGTNSAVEKERGPTTRVIDLGNRVVLPGFNDSHVHFLQGGLSLLRVDLSDASTVAKMQEKIKAYASANAGKKWIFGGGWNDDVQQLPRRKAPTKAELDAAVADRPVMLWNSNHDKLWVNTKALETLKLTSESGILADKQAFEASLKVDNPSYDELKAAFRAALENAAKFGITSVQGPLLTTRNDDEAKIAAELYSANQLTVRYSMWGDLEKPEAFLALKEKHKQLPEEWVHFDSVMGYLDGVLGSRTAALLDPYSDRPQTRGEPFYEQAKLNELVLSANRQGLPVALHAIGDRAVSMAVTAFSNARHLLFNSRVRNRIEHLEVVPAYVYPKIHDLGIIASMMPSHMVYDNEAQSYIDHRVGPQRAKHAFALRNFFNAKVHVTFGTEWPVMPLNPLIGLYAAVNRQHLNGRPLSGWQPSQRVTLEQSLEAYAMGGAYATHEEHVKGSLREGKFADVVVLDKDPFRTRGKDWLSIPVYMTIVNGKTVYDGTRPQIGPAKN